MATKYTAECKDKIPRWFASLNEHSTDYSMPSRPRTESINVNKPSWLTDLTETRRHSEQLSSLFETIQSPKCGGKLFEDNIIDLMKQYEGASEIKLHPVSKDDDSSHFEIPSLPTGRVLTVQVDSNWGDHHFVGFNGIEIFDASTGNLASVVKITVNGQLSREAQILVDNVYRSHDEKHIWQMSLDTLPVRIQFTFDQSVQIALLRIWNHNKSRIYWDRGIKDVKMYLDDVKIFQGEITRAQGCLAGPVSNLGDTILFTTQDEILEKIAVNDKSFR